MRPIPTSLVLLLTSAAALSAATWTGGGDGLSWNDPANWSDGAMPSASDTVWDIGEGMTAVLDGAAPGGQVVKSGAGTLRWETTASAAAVRVLQGTFDFGGGMIWPDVTLEGGTVTGYILEASTVVSGGTLAARAEGSLTLIGGPIMNVDVSAAYGLLLVEATLQGNLWAESSVWCADWAGASKVEGHLHLSAGSALAFSLQEPERLAPLIVTGELSSDYEMRLYFGLVDLSQPYWDPARDFLCADARPGSIVSATFTPDPYAGNDNEGTWGQVPDASGDVVMRWTPLASRSSTSAAATPEASTAAWATLAAAAAVAMRWRKRRCA